MTRATETTPVQYSVLAHEPQELRDAGLACLMAGDLSSAETLFRSGALKRPYDADFRFRLASTLMAQGRMEEAALHEADARNLMAAQLMRENFPDVEASRAPDAMLAAAQVFYKESQYSLCGLLLQRLLPDNADNLGLMRELGLVLSQQGRMDEAIATYETIVRRQGCAPEAHSYLHLLTIFQQTGPQTLYNEGRRWSRLCEETVQLRSPRRVRKDGKIRIGYYSATFNRHQLGHFFLPILEAHDTDRFEIYGYSHGKIVDNIGQAALDNCTFRCVGRMSDDEICDVIEADDIDILVDLWGHSHQHRLMVFARRPAPIQVSYLNYINTTGLTAFDYVLLPDGYRAEGDQRWFSEEIFGIGPVIAPYRVLDEVEVPVEAPNTRHPDGVFTFASAAHPSKINLEVVKVWAEILKRTPNAVLELRYMLYKDPVVTRAMVAQFEACGVPAERLVFPKQSAGKAFREAFADFDLVLDPFPYQGMTTTMDALSMGVPVLALDGDYLAMKVAPSALELCGVPELIAPTPQAYVDIAVDLATNPERLADIRRRTRPGFLASPFRQERAFTRRLEAAYLDMVAIAGRQAEAEAA